MPFKGETWIKTQTGWRTIRTIVINNKQQRIPLVTSPYSSDSEDEVIARTQHVCGIYWECGPPFVILPGECRKTSYLISRNSQTQCTIKSPPVVYIFNKLSFKQSLRNPRRFNYVTNMLEIVLKQDFVSTCSSSQKKLLTLFEQLVNTVLSTEINVHIAKHLVSLYKEKHLKNKGTFKRQKLWNTVLNKISSMERRLHRFHVKKICRGTRNSSNIHLTDLPSVVLHYLFRCFSDHQDIVALACVNQQFNRLSKDPGLWKNMCLYHLPPSKLVGIDPNIPSSWKNTYKTYIKRTTMRHSFADLLIICSDCHFVCWKGTHLCTLQQQQQQQQQNSNENISKKPPIAIPITPKGFCHLFER
ncbi:F-box only protein 32-like [Clytia hemisphaerica]|uniref:F-box domain-containing protein n=1 Tax=Clytia hemisphaerica TaxID=252671 RepID=A0A7M5V776_9CNID